MQLLGAAGIGGLGLRVQSRRVGIDTRARAQQIGHRQADDQRQCRNPFEVQEGLEPDAAHLLHVTHPGNSDDHGGEDDRRDHHLDQLHEGVAERLHLLGQGRIHNAQCDADQDGGKHLNVQVSVERLSAMGGGGEGHVASLDWSPLARTSLRQQRRNSP